ncbi:MAG TPA: dihydropteroate synthase [Chryseolinea sp.]|nr:dihydropteroate synthase [Chryseolinea sp.]
MNQNSITDYMKSWLENRIFYPNQTLNIGGRLIHLKEPKIMGILNVTPDSFYDGGRYDSDAAILEQTERMMKHGATFIDVGGYSSRPGADEIPVDEEIRRISKALKLIVKNFPEALISIDTFRSQVANIAIQEGAGMINDVSGGGLDSSMFELVASRQVPYVVMHMRGNPKTMNGLTNYENLTGDILSFFHDKIHKLTSLGIKDIIIDPGFGFAKTIEQNFALLNSLHHFNLLEKPLLVGLSRKSMIWKTLKTTPEHALNGSTCLNTIALMKGARILRVHDVKEASEACQLFSLTTAAS